MANKGQRKQDACAVCGKSPLPPYRLKYCSKECENASRRTVKERGDCKRCGEPLPVGRRSYCSDKCFGEHYAQMTIYCKNCGRPFKSKSGRHYCQFKACRAKSIEENLRRKAQMRGVVWLTCQNEKCGQTFPVSPKLKERRRKYCSADCANEARYGSVRKIVSNKKKKKLPCLGHGCNVVFLTTADKRFCPICSRKNKWLIGEYHEAALVGGFATF